MFLDVTRHEAQHKPNPNRNRTMSQTTALKNRTIHDVAADLMVARALEKTATEQRVAMEEELIALLGGAKIEGADTHHIGPYKVTITGKLNRKLDLKKYDQIVDRIPEALRPVKVKRELDVTGIKYLANNEPEIYAMLANAGALTAEPAKTSVTIIRIED
jgi:ABC-type lipoprotein release transport system permease subunit